MWIITNLFEYSTKQRSQCPTEPSEIVQQKTRLLLTPIGSYGRRSCSLTAVAAVWHRRETVGRISKSSVSVHGWYKGRRHSLTCLWHDSGISTFVFRQWPQQQPARSRQAAAADKLDWVQRSTWRWCVRNAT